MKGSLYYKYDFGLLTWLSVYTPSFFPVTRYQFSTLHQNSRPTTDSAARIGPNQIKLTVDSGSRYSFISPTPVPSTTDHHSDIFDLWEETLRSQITKVQLFFNNVTENIESLW